MEIVIAIFVLLLGVAGIIGSIIPGAADSFASALGAFLGFLFGTGIKLISSSVMLYYIVVFCF